MTNVFNKPSVLIVGAGEFGSTTAVELLRSGNYGSVTILDRATTLPALDAASTDINKVVRYDYADAEYAALACEAVRRWEQPQWKGVYFPTGVLMRGLTDGNAQEIYDNARKLEPRVKLMDNPADVKRRISPSGKAVLGKEAGIKSYWNPGGGWVHASGAINKLYDELKQRGAQIVPGAELASLIVEDGDVKGVRTVDRREFTADKVILALGSWTGGHPALKGIFPPELLVPTGHTIAAVQLTPAEQEQYKDVPTIANLDNSGFYMFPPNQTGQVKFALHAGGFTVPNAVPRTAADPEAVRYTEANRVGWIPKQSFKVMREKLAGLYPELAKSEQRPRYLWMDSSWLTPPRADGVHAHVLVQRHT